MFNQCKAHKCIINNCPYFKPIPNPINTSLYKLATFFVPILSSSTINDIISLSRDKQLCLMKIRFESYFSHQRVRLRDRLKNSIEQLKGKISNFFFFAVSCCRLKYICFWKLHWWWYRSINIFTWLLSYANIKKQILKLQDKLVFKVAFQHKHRNSGIEPITENISINF